MLIAKRVANAYPHYVREALDIGLPPAELAEPVTHLAFYARWVNAFGATAASRGILDERCIAAGMLPRPDAAPPAAGDALPG